jgi:hypothetical protein
MDVSSETRSGPERRQDRLSIGRSVLVIALLSALGWAAVIALVVVVLRLVG